MKSAHQDFLRPAGTPGEACPGQPNRQCPSCAQQEVRFWVAGRGQGDQDADMGGDREAVCKPGARCDCVSSRACAVGTKLWLYSLQEQIHPIESPAEAVQSVPSRNKQTETGFQNAGTDRAEASLR